MKQTPGPVIGAPSFVMPANVADNARFLAGRVDEVALCLFEARSCLAYDDEDLPPALADLPLSWHVHLPVDLPWPRKKDAEAVRVAVELALRVFDRVAWLKPWGAGLHAPKGSPVLQRFILRQAAACWQRRSKIPLLLENTDICDIAGLGRGFPADHGLGFCLDVGHLMGYAQNALWASPLPETAALVHWSAPGTQDQHLALHRFTAAQQHLARQLAGRLPGNCRHLLEIFRWQGVEESLPLLRDLLASQPDTVSPGCPHGPNNAKTAE